MITQHKMNQIQKGTRLWVVFNPVSLKFSQSFLHCESLWFLLVKICYHETWGQHKRPAVREWERRWAGQPDWEMSQRGVSAPVELVKTIVPLCLSRLCLSAWRGLILARACSRWFIKMGPGKTRGPGEKETFTCMHNAHKRERTHDNTTPQQCTHGKK